jgi:uncharacterized protein YlxP (DUF503 family)
MSKPCFQANNGLCIAQIATSRTAINRMVESVIRFVESHHGLAANSSSIFRGVEVRARFLLF